MRKIIGSMIGVFLLVGNAPQEDAVLFGARAGVEHISLSPDGSKVAVIAPTTGQGSIAYVMDIKTATAQRPFLMASGQPERLTRCKWVSNSRLVCSVFFVDRQPDRVVGATRTIAIDENGNNLKILSTRQNFHSHSIALYGGSVIDWLPEQDGKVLMVRNYVPDTHIGSRIGSNDDGLGVWPSP